MKKTVSSLLLAALFSLKMFGQPDDGPSLLDMLGDDEPTTNFITGAFKGTRVVNGHSLEMLLPGTMDFRILHRMGKVSGGFYEFFGLDAATMRMGFDFGLTKNLGIGIGRSTSRKELDVFAKYRILHQSTGKKRMPISLILVSGATRNGLKNAFGPDVEATFVRRLGYYHELLIGRKFSERFTLQVAPMLIHRNLVENRVQPNNVFAASVGGRFKIRKRMAIIWDYAHAFNRFPGDPTADPLSIGIDIETGGHVFQLHFSNAVGMNERAFVTDSNGSWLKGDVQFGFNLSRVFQIKKKKI